MTVPRPYHRAMTVDAALDELVRCAGSQFDPDVVAPLVALVRGGFDITTPAATPAPLDRSASTEV